MKTVFPSFHEVIEIISEVYTYIGSKDLVTLQRTFRTHYKKYQALDLHALVVLLSNN